MRPSSFSRGLVVAWLLVSLPALAEEDVKIDWAPYAGGLLSLQGGNLEIGAKVERGHWQARLVGRVPIHFEGSNEASITRDSTTWGAGLYIDYQLLEERSPDGRNMKDQWLASKLEWGLAAYEYFPGAGEQATKEMNHSFAAETNLIWHSTKVREKGSMRMAPQVKLRYSRQWAASDPVNMVIPGEGDTPASIRAVIVDAPRARPEFSIRGAMPISFPSWKELALSPSLTYSAGGEDNAILPTVQTGRLRGELFLHWFPVVQGGPRVGIGPFIDVKLHGEKGKDPIEAGALLQLRMDTRFWEY
jgi:hypothetical protein